MTENEYQCAVCKHIYRKGWSEAEAQAEKQRLFPDTPLEECAVVCDDCWQTMRKNALRTMTQLSGVDEWERLPYTSSGKQGYPFHIYIHLDFYLNIALRLLCFPSHSCLTATEQ